MTKINAYFLNPVKIVTDSWQIATAFCILIISILLSYFNGIVHDGIYHATYAPKQSFTFLIISNIIVVLLPSLLLFAAGKYFNKGTRFVDMWNMFLFSRLPIIIGYAIFYSVVNHETLSAMSSGQLNINQIPKSELSKISITGLLVIPFLIYSFVLLTNGFKTSMYAKKPIHYVLMILAIIIAEIIYRFSIFPSLIKFSN